MPNWLQYWKTADLALMVLGNMVTHVINTRVTPEMRNTLVKSLIDALHASVLLSDTH